MSNDTAPRGIWNTALIVSLCLNCLLIGMIVMTVLRVPSYRPWGVPEAPPLLGGGRGMWQMNQLSPQAMLNASPGKAEQLRAIIEAHRPRIHALRLASFDARVEARRLLAEPAFDKNAFDRALAKIQNNDAALETEVLKAVSESVAALSPEERRAAAAAAPGRGRGWQRGQRWQFQNGP